MNRPSRDDCIYLRHILESIAYIRSFTNEALHSFHEVPETWFATLRVLQTLSESAMHLSDSVKVRMPAIHWHRIRGFRNILVHDYLGDIDPAIVRGVIEIELPKLEQEISRILEEDRML